MQAYWTEHTDLLGDITIQSDGDAIRAIHFGCIAGEGLKEKTQVLHRAFRQLHEYLNGERKRFTLSIQLEGTPFMRRIYRALMDIPYGRTASYEDIARIVGSPRACRAVGMANGKNPLPIVVPCHRVIRKNGDLGGFGPGISYKQALLALENAHGVD